MDEIRGEQRSEYRIDERGHSGLADPPEPQ